MLQLILIFLRVPLMKQSANVLLLGGLLALSMTSPQARNRPMVDEPAFTREDVEEGAPWQESGHRLPPYPEAGDLVEFQVDTPDKRLRYFIDGTHLSVGEDGVVRYSLVIQAGTSASNVSFEGMRCATWEVKTYAFGTGQEQLKPLAGAQWERIRRSGPYHHHLDLHEFYFCKPSRLPYNAEEILRRMRAPIQRSESEPLF